jgi:hypothetical protein
MEYGSVSASAFHAFFRAIAFSRLPVMVCEHGAAPRRPGGVGLTRGARQRERAKTRNGPARRGNGSAGKWKHAFVSASAFQAFFRAFAFSRLPVMVCEHGTAPRRRGGAGSAMGARQRERAKSRNRPARRSWGSVGGWEYGSVSASAFHAFFRAFAFSRLPVMVCEHGTAPRRPGGAGSAMGARQRERAKQIRAEKPRRGFPTKFTGGRPRHPRLPIQLRKTDSSRFTWSGAICLTEFAVTRTVGTAFEWRYCASTTSGTCEVDRRPRKTENAQTYW